MGADGRLFVLFAQLLWKFVEKFLENIAEVASWLK